MITSAEEFIRLRTSDSIEEQERASSDALEPGVWNDIISKYPKFKTWVIHNKTVPLEILSALAKDPDPLVREAVARKRKIDDNIFNTLAIDPDENVRYALMCNTKLTKDKKSLIKTDDSEWLQTKLKESFDAE